IVAQSSPFSDREGPSLVPDQSDRQVHAHAVTGIPIIGDSHHLLLGFLRFYLENNLTLIDHKVSVHARSFIALFGMRSAGNGRRSKSVHRLGGGHAACTPRNLGKPTAFRECASVTAARFKPSLPR